MANVRECIEAENYGKIAQTPAAGFGSEIWLDNLTFQYISTKIDPLKRAA